MGAGQGRSRRVQTSPASTAVKKQLPVTFDGKKWAAFVTKNGLSNVSVTKYYLKVPPRSPGVPEREKVMLELFADAVQLGAITIPSSYIWKDFEFKRVNNLKVEAVLRHRPKFRVEFRFSMPYLTAPMTTMARTTYSLRQLAKGVDALLHLAHP